MVINELLNVSFVCMHISVGIFTDCAFPIQITVKDFKAKIATSVVSINSEF